MGDYMVGHGTAMIQHFTDRKAATGTKVEHPATLIGLEPFEAQDMGVNQIADMHIVPNAGAIGHVIASSISGIKCVSG